jgi:hypothetical protein
MHVPSAVLLASVLLAGSTKARFVMYADEWHPTRPTDSQDRAGIDHVILAFAPANATAQFQPKVPIHTIRTEYPLAKVMIAVGGWADTAGFYEATKSDASMRTFAADIATMLSRTGADGVGEYNLYRNWVLMNTDIQRHRLGISWRQWCRLQTNHQLGPDLPDRRIPQIASCYSYCHWEEASLDCCAGKRRLVGSHVFEGSELTGKS